MAKSYPPKMKFQVVLELLEPGRVRPVPAPPVPAVRPHVTREMEPAPGRYADDQRGRTVRRDFPRHALRGGPGVGGRQRHGRIGCDLRRRQSGAQSRDPCRRVLVAYEQPVHAA